MRRSEYILLLLESLSRILSMRPHLREAVGLLAEGRRNSSGRKPGVGKPFGVTSPDKVMCEVRRQCEAEGRENCVIGSISRPQ